MCHMQIASEFDKLPQDRNPEAAFGMNLSTFIDAADEARPDVYSPAQWLALPRVHRTQTVLDQR